MLTIDLLKKDVGTWNKARLNGEEIPSLAGARLTGADLRKADLTAANLSNADLAAANLAAANLTAANLSEADLTKADLTKADLTKADLTRAGLTRAGLKGARLTWVDLNETDLTEADLSDADLTGVTIGPIKLEEIAPIKNLKELILDAIGPSAGGLDMAILRTCDTVRCLAGWALALHPDKRLENADPWVAASLIFLVSCGEIPDFYSSNKEALAWLRT